MLKFFNADKKNSLKKLEEILNLRKNNQKIQTSKVRQIIYNVKKRGDNAVISYEKKFSKIKTNSKKLKFTKNEVDLISKKVDRGLKKAIDLAFSRIKLFHTKQKFSSFKFKDNHKNELSYKYTPIENVGVYVPGGTCLLYTSPSPRDLYRSRMPSSA